MLTVQASRQRIRPKWRATRGWMGALLLTCATIAVAFLAMAGFAAAQSRTGRMQSFAPAGPAFDVVSIKPADMGTSTPATNGLHISPGRFYDGYVTIEGLIRWAYDIQFNSGLTGGPAWTRFAGRNDLYVVTATMAPGLTLEQIRACLRRVLEERFGLVMHTESKSIAYLALEVAPGGAKFLPGRGALPGSTPPQGSWPGGVGCRRNAGCKPISLQVLASSLPIYTHGQTVIDRTGLSGEYYIGFWSRETVEHFISIKAAVASGAPSTETALRQQLGLELEKVRGPMPIAVIDRVHQPAMN